MSQWAKETYNRQYESWMPWIEDQYLRWFTKDNKVSYTAKQNLDQTKVTGVSQVDNLQDGVNNLAAGQLGQGGLLQPVSDMASKEGVNRTERQGKDNNGSYVPSNMPGAEAAGNVVSGAAEGGKSVASGLGSGLKGATGYLGLGGGKEEEQQQKK